MPYTKEGTPFIDQDTSEAAAHSLTTTTLSKLRLAVLQTIDSSIDGMTCDEVEVKLRMRHQTASARIRDLFLAGYIRDSGKRRRTRSKRFAIVWIARRALQLL